MDNFKALQELVQNRRSTKPALLNGKKIADQQIRSLLELANWAPTHARTEPWRFVVFSGDAIAQFSADHAALYKANTPEDKYTEAKYEGLLHTADNASHVIAVYMKRLPEAKVPVVEDIAAVAAAVQNILLGAQALGIAVLWSTGGMVHQPAMKTYFGLGEQDVMMGLLYMGHTDEPTKEGKRNSSGEEKSTWK
jgi:nitroreductase